MSIVISGTDGITPLKTTNGSAGAPSVTGTDTDTGLFFGTNEVNIATGGTERAKVDSSGRLLVGTASVSHNSRAVIAGRQDGNAAGTLVLESTSSSPANGDTLGNLRYGTSGNTASLSAASIGAERDGGTWTNNSSMPTRLVFYTTANGASSPTERMRIENTGRTVITGTYTNPITANRLTDDGIVIAIQQNTTTEGSISVSGTTVSYNGAHLSRWSQLLGIDPYDKTARPEILRGTVMSNLDEMCDWTCPTSGDCQDNEQLNKTKISDVEGDRNVAGVFQSWDNDDDTWVNDFYLAMTGDFVIRVAAGTTVQRGDLLMSAGDGTAKPQDDDAVRSCTIAKVTSTTVSCTYDDGSYCVPCVLMAC